MATCCQQRCSNLCESQEEHDQMLEDIQRWVIALHRAHKVASSAEYVAFVVKHSNYLGQHPNVELDALIRETREALKAGKSVPVVRKPRETMNNHCI